LPWWRTIRAITTTRRLGERDARDSAARRPLPNAERPLVPLPRLNSLPVSPAFLAACMTWPTKLFGRLAPRFPCRIRPGRRLISSSRTVMAIDIREKMTDGARCIEFVELCDVSASRHPCPNTQNFQSNQPHAHDGRRGFHLAIRGSYLPAPTASHQNMRQSATDCDEVRSRSLRPNLASTMDKQVVRLRHESGKIDNGTNARWTA
jgi:hypothetical protein